MSDAAIVPSPIGTPKSVRNYEREEREYVGDPWTKQERESGQASKAFQHFLNQPPDTRTKTEAARRYNGERGNVIKKQGNYLNGWPRKHRWDERVEAYDAFCDAKLVTANRRRLIRSSVKHADQAAAAQSIIMLSVDELRKRIEDQGGQLDIVSAMEDGDLIKLYKAMIGDLPSAQQMERNALAATTDVVVAPKDLREKGARVLRMLKDKNVRVLMERVSIEGDVDPDSD